MQCAAVSLACRDPPHCRPCGTATTQENPMSNTSHRWRSPLRALLLSVLAASAAHAQDENIQEIVVTGSRIAAPNLTSTSPVQVVSSKEIQQTGRTDVVEILNQLPQVIQNSAVDFSNTSNSLSTPGGLTTVNLRG